VIEGGLDRRRLDQLERRLERLGVGRKLRARFRS
jgi:hypothetical protein